MSYVTSASEARKEPPFEIQLFYDKVQSLPIEEIAKLPQYINLNDIHHCNEHPLLQIDGEFTSRLQDAYPRSQCAFFEIAGRCQMSGGCNVSVPHPHGIQAPPVFRVKDFGKVAIYRDFLLPVMPEMLDEMFEVCSETDGDFGRGPNRSGSLRREYTAVLDHFHPGCAIPGVKFNLTSVDQTCTLRNGGLSGKLDRYNSMYTIFGCDAIFVIGKGAYFPEDDDGPEAEISWDDLVTFEPENKEDTTGHYTNNESNVQTKAKQEFELLPRYSLAAIHLRAGDVLRLERPIDDESTWWGIARVFDHSSRPVCYQVPHLWQDSTDEVESQATRGLLAGRTLEMEFS